MKFNIYYVIYPILSLIAFTIVATLTNSYFGGWIGVILFAVAVNFYLKKQYQDKKKRHVFLTKMMLITWIAFFIIGKLVLIPSIEDTGNVNLIMAAVTFLISKFEK